MKRWFTAMLALILIVAQIPAGLTAGAEALEPVADPLEPPVELVEDADLEDLMADVGDWVEEPDAGEILQEAPAEPGTGDTRYARVIAERAALRESADGPDFAGIDKDSVVLVLSLDDAWAKIAFNADQGVVTALTAAENLAMLDDGQISAFMDALAESGAVALYDDNLDMPLQTLFLFPLDTEAEAVEVEAEAADEIVGETEEAMLAAIAFEISDGELEMTPGQSRTISALDAKGKSIAVSKLTFESSDTAVATVSAKGVVKAKKAGSAEISITYNRHVLICDVNVRQEAKSIKIAPTTISIGVKEAYTGLQVTASPEDASAAVTWTSSNARVASVDPETGAVYGLKAGTATLTAKTDNGKKATCKVKVLNAPTELDMTPTAMKLGFGGATGQLSIKTQSRYAYGVIRYTTSNAKVATVNDDGLVTSVGSGRATITATAYNGVTATCEVWVLGEPAEVRFSADALQVGTAQTATLTAVPYDKSGNETEAALTYSVDAASPNKKCITVNARTGQVKGVSSGRAILRATAANGATGTCTVDVVAVPTAIKLNHATGSMGVNETYSNLVATLVPPKGEDTCAAEITWSSSNAKVVSVDARTGELTALKTGSATITAKTSNNLKATCKVTVKRAPTSIAISPATLKISAGGMSETLNVSISRNTVGNVTFTSSDPAIATVDDNGVVTSGKEGTAIITAHTYNGLTAECMVTVCGEPGKVALKAMEITVGMGDKASVQASALTASGNEAITTLTYYVEKNSPDPGCIKLDAKTGAITTVSKGVAYVNARTHNGITAPKPCTVTVMAKPKSLSLPAKASMGMGETADALDAELTFQDGTTAPATGLTWTSSNKRVLTVDADTGALEALKTGSSTVTAKTAGGLKATCRVTVEKAPTSVTLKPATLKLSAGGMKFQTTVSVNGGSASDVTYSSSNTKVAKVNAKGVVTTVGTGTATITATTYNGKTSTCAVTVTGTPAMASFSKTSLTIGAEETVIPEVRVKAADGSEAMANLSFRVLSGARYIDLDADTGAITAVEAGTSVIGVTTHNGIEASNTCTITVVALPSRIVMSASSPIMGVGETVHFSTRVTAPKGADTSVTWSSSNAKVASVTAKGVVRAVSTGSATITAETVNGLKATCKLTVYKAPTSITLTPSNGSVVLGESATFRVRLSSGSGGYVGFTSSDPDIADIDDEGVVTGYALGRVTITATTYNGKTATAKLTVKKASSTIIDDDGDDDGGDEVDDRIEEVIALAESVLGTKYVYGGGYKKENPSGFDCSGLVYWCYYYGAGIKLKDSAAKQGSDSTYERIDDIDDLRRGDVVCFKPDNSSTTTVSHTGIYLGDGEFIHAATGNTNAVTITSIHKDYYTRNFLWGRRIID